jgi:hypothetical protein
MQENSVFQTASQRKMRQNFLNFPLCFVRTMSLNVSHGMPETSINRKYSLNQDFSTRFAIWPMFLRVLDPLVQAGTDWDNFSCKLFKKVYKVALDSVKNI